MYNQKEESRPVNLYDQWGRLHSNLRISITDRCNLRCRYCVVSEKIDWIDKDQSLTVEEIISLSNLFSELGVDRLRITGGEPLVNPDVGTIIARLKSEVPKIKKINMTTNAVLLHKYLPDFLDAKLDSINISLDTLKPDRFSYITKNNSFHQV